MAASIAELKTMASDLTAKLHAIDDKEGLILTKIAELKEQIAAGVGVSQADLDALAATLTEAAATADEAAAREDAALA